MDNDQQKAFLDLYTANQRQLYGYIVTLASNRSDAEEIFSEMTLALWESWAQFDPTRCFVSWACGIARHKVLQYQSRRERRWEGLSDEVVSIVAEEQDRLRPILTYRAELLSQCVEQLKHWQRQLLETCYSSAESIAMIAQQLGKTPNALSSQLRRIRQVLHRCVDRATQMEEPQE